MNLNPVGKVIDKYQAKRTALISILHDIQDHYHYLPAEALKEVACKLGLDLTELYGVATFYKSFSLTPKGKYCLTLCLGTACHVRGGPNILREMEKKLGIKPGESTGDGKFSLDVANCLGVCAVGPVMRVDGKFYGEMNPAKAKKLIEKVDGKRAGGRHEKNQSAV